MSKNEHILLEELNNQLKQLDQSTLILEYFLKSWYKEFFFFVILNDENLRAQLQQFIQNWKGGFVEWCHKNIDSVQDQYFTKEEYNNAKNAIKANTDAFEKLMVDFVGKIS
jgi:hypothetical protein